MWKSTPICVVFWAATMLPFHSKFANAYGTSSGATPSPDPPRSFPEHSNNGNYESTQWGGVGHGEEGHGGHNQHQESSEYQKPFPEKRKDSYTEKYGVPEGCADDADPYHRCNYFVEITKEKDDPDALHFELTGHIEGRGGYVAVGLSEDKYMGEDHIVECVQLDDGRTSYYHSWSKSKTRPDRLQHDPSVIKMEGTYPKYEDGILTCRFRRPLRTEIKVDGLIKIFDLKYNDFHILLAGGLLDKVGADSIGYHGRGPLDRYASPNKMEFSKHLQKSGCGIKSLDSKVFAFPLLAFLFVTSSFSYFLL